MHNLKNTSYIFVPFMYGKQADFKPLVAAFSNSASWRQVHDEIAYMFKYVADKIDSYNEATCQCFHFELVDSCRAEFELATENTWFSTQPHTFSGNEESIRFKIINIQLYCFSTAVGIIAFKIQLEKNDPFWIANAQYYGTINYLYVRPEWRRQGIGGELLKHVENQIAASSIRFARVLVDPHNAALIKFCENLGYSERQLIMKKRVQQTGSAF